MSDDHSFLDGSRRHDRFRSRGISEGLHILPSSGYVLASLEILEVPYPEIEVTATLQLQITYDGNGNTGGSPPTDSSWYNSGSDVVVEDSGTLVREDPGSPTVPYNFSCWNTQADGLGVDYDPDDFYTITTMATLYAKWVVA